MDKTSIIAELRAANPKAAADRIHRYADAYMTYREAADNIDRNGAVCSHPRTGAPIENPYLSIRDKAGKLIGSLHLAAPGLWPEGAAR